MPSFQGEVISDERGREVVRFTTASGVQAIVDTSIPMSALEKMVRKLALKLRRSGHLTDAAGTGMKRPRRPGK